MNKKRLPKAVLRTADQMRDETPAANPLPQDNVVSLTPKSDATERDDTENAATKNAAAETGASPLPVAVANASRRRQAVAIVERYANGSSIGGAIPIPLLNAVAITALLVRMVRALSKLYGVPFEKNRTRSLVIGLMGGALPTGFSTIATSTMTYFIPGLNLVGLAVSSVTSGAYARSIGQLFIEHFENGTELGFRNIIKR